MNEKTHSRFDLSSRPWKTVLVMLTALFVFLGPYMVLMLNRVLDLDYTVSMVSGIAVFMVGLALIWYLMRKHVIS